MAEKKSQKRRTMRKSQKKGGSVKSCGVNKHRNKQTRRCRCVKICKM